MYALSSASLGRQVVDRSGLKGKYNFDLLWTPDDDAAEAARPEMPDGGSLGAPPTSLFTAIQEQLGLRLEPARALVDALLIEHIERPTSN